MSEQKRASLTSLGSTKKDKKSKERPKTVRFTLTLAESNEEACPEFNYRVLLGSAERKRRAINSARPDGVLNGLDPYASDDDEQLKNLARQYEEKYGGSGGRKRPGRFEDYVDLGAGYDENDPFIDNTDAYDEIVPEEITTAHGGFYINCGQLEFKEVVGLSDGDEDRDSKIKKTFKKPKIKRTPLRGTNSEHPELLKKRKFVSHEHDFIKKKKKLAIVDLRKKGNTVKELLREKRNQLSADSPENNHCIVTEQIVPNSPPRNIATNVLTETKKSANILESKKSATALSIDDAIESVVSAARSNDDSSQDSSSSASKSGSGSSVSSDNTDDSQELPEAASSPGANPITSSANAPLNSNLSNAEVKITAVLPSLSASQLSSNAPATILSASPNIGSRGEETQLPPDLPNELVELVTALKKAAQTSAEGKCKFFSNDVNQKLLSVELKVQALSCSRRQLVYSHLAAYLPCTKDTLMKRAKKLRLGSEELKLKEPMAKLEAAIGQVMPGVIDQYTRLCQKVAEEKSAEEPSKDGTPNETKSRIPRKTFPWSEETRSLLQQVVAMKRQCLLLQKPRKESIEELLRVFLDQAVKPLWPPGWMRLTVLCRMAELRHGGIMNRTLPTSSMNSTPSSAILGTPTSVGVSTSQPFVSKPRKSNTLKKSSLGLTTPLTLSAASSTAVITSLPAPSPSLSPPNAKAKIEFQPLTLKTESPQQPPQQTQRIKSESSIQPPPRIKQDPSLPQPPRIKADASFPPSLPPPPRIKPDSTLPPPPRIKPDSTLPPPPRIKPDSTLPPPPRIKPDSTLPPPPRIKPDASLLPPPPRIKPDASLPPPPRIKPDTSLPPPPRIKPDASLPPPPRIKPDASLPPPPRIKPDASLPPPPPRIKPDPSLSQPRNKQELSSTQPRIKLDSSLQAPVRKTDQSSVHQQFQQQQLQPQLQQQLPPFSVSSTGSVTVSATTKSTKSVIERVPSKGLDLSINTNISHPVLSGSPTKLKGGSEISIIPMGVPTRTSIPIHTSPPATPSTTVSASAGLPLINIPDCISVTPTMPPPPTVTTHTSSSSSSPLSSPLAGSNIRPMSLKQRILLDTGNQRTNSVSRSIAPTVPSPNLPPLSPLAHRSDDGIEVIEITEEGHTSSVSMLHSPRSRSDQPKKKVRPRIEVPPSPSTAVTAISVLHPNPERDAETDAATDLISQIIHESQPNYPNTSKNTDSSSNAAAAAAAAAAVSTAASAVSTAATTTSATIITTNTTPTTTTTPTNCSNSKNTTPPPSLPQPHASSPHPHPHSHHPSPTHHRSVIQRPPRSSPPKPPPNTISSPVQSLLEQEVEATSETPQPADAEESVQLEMDRVMKELIELQGHISGEKDTVRTSTSQPSSQSSPLNPISQVPTTQETPKISSAVSVVPVPHSAVGSVASSTSNSTILALPRGPEITCTPVTQARSHRLPVSGNPVNIAPTSQFPPHSFQAEFHKHILQDVPHIKALLPKAGSCASESKKYC